ncbi:phosphoglycerate kinase [Maribius pontilimi]|uniref:Phosphoglycerate kinase n=1 Tax=Palleronia pontilimi TaxID=1964209 RepID=A0A934IID2_9RHOB|nr:phosphoglycerate kinase [Palleronia pontilimi]MBJ3763468.1 phosphoglycerate kinase [Palleronia pontilimi]
MGWKTLDDMDLDGKRVLVRVDVNVPVEDGRVTDTTRIDRIVPTIKDIQSAGGIPILLAHFDRPKGKVVPEMSLGQIVPALSQALGQDVTFIDGDYGDRVGKLAPGDVALLENTRFNPGEEKNDAGFAKRLASLGDIYVNDAFSAAHRAHSSTEAIAHLLPACAGRLMAEELHALERALGNPARPLMAVVGGAKVSTKIDLLANLVRKVNHLVIGGGMANTFLAALGHDVGKSLAEHDMTDTARDILAKADEVGCEILLPHDVVVAREFKAGAASEVVPADACPADAMILDTGPDSVERIGKAMSNCKTLIWNGPLGAFEIAPFDTATNQAARMAADRTKAGKLVSVAGGGDTVAALNKAEAADDFTYISSAGGAFLEWMEGKTLPGVAALGG